MRFGDQACMCRVDTSMSRQKQTHCPPTKASWLFDELSDNDASDDGLYANVAANKQISEVILMLGNVATLVAYLINAHYNTYAHDGTFCYIN